MIDAPLALAFTAGLIAAFNPCGFAMLPAYVGFFVGQDDRTRRRSTGRALAVGLTASAGFTSVFVIAGILIEAGLRSFIRYVPWLSVWLGGVLVVVGVALLAGRHVNFSLPRLNQGGIDRTLVSIYLFGVSYAVVSLGCTLPVFLTVVTGTIARANFISGVMSFLAYASGMSLVLMTVTLAVAWAKGSFLARLRSASRTVDRASGMLLIVTGAYVAYYWTRNLTTSPGSSTGAGPTRWVEQLSTSTSIWFLNHRSVVSIILAGLVIATTVYNISRHSFNRQSDPMAAGGSTSGTDCCSSEFDVVD